VLAGLGSADREPNSRTNDYEEPGNVDVVAVIDGDPPYIRVEKILVRPSSVLFNLCAADQWRRGQQNVHFKLSISLHVLELKYNRIRSAIVIERYPPSHEPWARSWYLHMMH
jgi:hypothetical protein